MRNKENLIFSFWLNLQEKSKIELRNIFSLFEKYTINEVLAIGSYSKTVLAASIARQKNIFFQTWKMMLINNDKQILREHKDWFTINRNGESSAEFPPYVNYYRWLCPNHPEVLPYLKNIVTQFCQIPELSGFHLDYIRFADVILPPKCQRQYNLIQSTEEAQFDFCYCPNCISGFKNKYGYDILSIKDPTQDENWRLFRWQCVTDLVNQLADLVHFYDKQISAAVFPTPDIAQTLVRQDWTSWNIDAFYPMMYNVFYDKDIDWLTKAVSECTQKTDKPIHAGIFLPSLSPAQLHKTIERLLKLDITGISFFNFHAADIEKLNIIKSFK